MGVLLGKSGVALGWVFLATLAGVQSTERAQVPTQSGLRYVRVSPLQRNDELARLLENLLREQGWSIAPYAQGSRRASERDGQTMQCWLGTDNSGWGTTASIECEDPAGEQIVAVSARGVALTDGGERKAAVRNLADKLRSAVAPDHRPTSSGQPPPRPEPRAAGSGTGFLCAPGIVATNAHVIEGATSIEWWLPVQRRSIRLHLLVSDPQNDLALLRIADADLANLPQPLHLARAAEPQLGADAIVVGFPLGEVLGFDHKVTSGIVSGLEGLRGDPRMLQVTAAIQPGSSGSPLFDDTGKVIGLITSTLDTVRSIQASGQAPQNVNFAVKAGYLGILLQRVPQADVPTQQEGLVRQSVSTIVERVRSSVGLIRTSR